MVSQEFFQHIFSDCESIDSMNTTRLPISLVSDGGTLSDSSHYMFDTFVPEIDPQSISREAAIKTLDELPVAMDSDSLDSLPESFNYIHVSSLYLNFFSKMASQAVGVVPVVETLKDGPVAIDLPSVTEEASQTPPVVDRANEENARLCCKIYLQMRTMMYTPLGRYCPLVWSFCKRSMVSFTNSLLTCETVSSVPTLISDSFFMRGSL